MNGIAQLQARQLARKGRYGDDDILHVSKAEIAGLDNLARSMYGHELPRNPETGAKEAFLFLPMLAPMLAGGLGMSGVLGTAAIGAGLGTAEAAARGMDDPLQHGLMAGIGAGAGSMLSSGISAAGQAGADAATQAPMAAIDATAGTVGGTPTQSALMNAQNAQVLGHDAAAGVLQAGGGVSDAMAYVPTGTAPTAVTSGTTTPSPFFDTSKVSADMSKFGSGLKNVFTDQTAAQKFLDNPNTLKGAIGTGMAFMGQDQLERAQESREAGEARDAEREAAYQKLKGTIKDRYAAAGRSGWWDQAGALNPNFADGGQVFPMQTGGFVVPKYAVDAAGAGDNEKGLMALKRHVGAKPIRGKGTGTSDSIPAKIDGKQPARVSNGEAYVPPKNVKKAGGSAQFYQMLNAAKKARTRRA